MSACRPLMSERFSYFLKVNVAVLRSLLLFPGNGMGGSGRVCRGRSGGVEEPGFLRPLTKLAVMKAQGDGLPAGGE